MNATSPADTDSIEPPLPAEPVLDAVSLTALRGPAVHRLLDLRAHRRLTRSHVSTTAQGLEVSDRTVWRWLADASADPATTASPGARRTSFRDHPEIRVLPAYWHGNASAVHRELVARARTAPTTPAPPDTGPSAFEPAVPPSRSSVPGGAPPQAVPLLDPVPSSTTFLRAVRRDLTAGERAGYRQGPEAARVHDVFAKLPRTWRNEVWEADHVQAPLRVDADGTLVHPYVTWFIASGVAVTPGCPTRASVLAALRSAIVRTTPYGPTIAPP